MIIVLFIVLAIIFFVILLLTLPVRIYGMASGDLYNGRAGIDVRVLPLGGVLGAGVLRPEGGQFGLWLYVFGHRTLKIPLPDRLKEGGDMRPEEDSADFGDVEPVEPIDFEDAGVYGEYQAERVQESPSEHERPSLHDDVKVRGKKAETGKKAEPKGRKAGKPRKPLMERIRGGFRNLRKYWQWAKTALDDLWYIVRIELLAGHVTIGLINHPATVGTIMGAFTAINAVLPKPFRITVHSEFTRTALEGRLEGEVLIFLHRIWITIVRRRKMILAAWREFKSDDGQVADILSVEDIEDQDIREQEPVSPA